MTSLERLDDAPSGNRIRGGLVGGAVGALVAFPLLAVGLEPMGLAVPIGVILGAWFAPAVQPDRPLPVGTIGVLAGAAVLLGDALVVAAAGVHDLAAAGLWFTLGLASLGLPALAPATIAAVLGAVALRWLERVNAV